MRPLDSLEELLPPRVHGIADESPQKPTMNIHQKTMKIHELQAMGKSGSGHLRLDFQIEVQERATYLKALACSPRY